MTRTELNEKIKNCTKCRLHLTRTQTVPGVGPSPCDYMFLGEAPGRIEDATGIPFNNKEGAGKVLSALLYASGFKRSEVYITNPVKCRPPNNRVPDPDELAACREYLDAEISLVNPKVIAALGEVASLISTGRGVHSRGYIEPNSYLGKPVLITYHPAYFTYGERLSMFDVVVHDFSKLHNLDEILSKKDPQNYILDPSLETLKAYFEKWKDIYVAVDIETKGDAEAPSEEKAGLDPFEDEIIGIAFCGEYGTALHLSKAYMEKYWNELKTFLETHDLLVYQNNRFDRAFLKLKGINSNLSFDTFTFQYLENPAQTRKLDHTRSLYTNFLPYKEKYKKRGKVSHLDPIKLGWYNCRDVDCTREIALEQQKQQDERLSFLMKRVCREDTQAIKMRIRGVQISQEAIASHYIQLKPKIEKMEANFLQTHGLEITSPKQIGKLLFDKLHLTDYSRKRSTQEEYLLKIMESFIGNPPEKEIVQSILNHREIFRTASTYCEGIFKRIKPDGRLHPDWLPTGTDTGRWSCKDPSLMNIPLFMRDIVVAPKGKVLMGPDYSKMQVWGAAILSEDEELIAVLKDPNRNIHKEVLASIEEVYPLTQNVGEDQALLRAKAVVFGTIFGRQASDIAQEFKVEPIVAKMWQDQYLNRFHKMRDWLNSVVDFWKTNGYVEGIYGRRKYAKKPTDAMNHPVQNFEAEVVINAMFALEEKGFNIIITVHDQLVAEEPEENCEERFEEMCHIMSTCSPDIWPYFPVAGSISDNWKGVK